MLIHMEDDIVINSGGVSGRGMNLVALLIALEARNVLPVASSVCGRLLVGVSLLANSPMTAIRRQWSILQCLYFRLVTSR